MKRKHKTTKREKFNRAYPVQPKEDLGDVYGMIRRLVEKWKREESKEK